MTDTAPDDLETNLEFSGQASATVTFHGRLGSQSSSASWQKLEAGLRGKKLEKLEVDMSRAQITDSIGMALLRYLNMGQMTPGAVVSIRGLDPEAQRLFERFTLEDYLAFRPEGEAKCHPLPEEVGRGVVQVGSDLREQFEFIGGVTRNLLPTLTSRRRLRMGEVRHIFELAGANAVPIVSLMSFLVGLIIAFESAQPLAQFGAQIYIVNMIGLIMVRDLGPLITAILLAGRSASAFAAEIGTMKVNEELDALKTFGLNPLRFLVIQRIIGAVLLTPLLTLYATFLGIGGGVIVAMMLGFPWALIFHQLAASVHITDIAFGLAKAVVFGIIFSAIGCLRGLQTRQGPSAVGISTTRAVVSSIVLVIIADAIFAVLFFLYEQ